MKRVLIVALFSMGLALTIAATATAAQIDITPAGLLAADPTMGGVSASNLTTWVPSVSGLPIPADSDGDSLGISGSDFYMTVGTNPTPGSYGNGGSTQFSFNTPVTLGQLVAVNITWTAGDTGTIAATMELDLGGTIWNVVPAGVYPFISAVDGGVTTLSVTEGTTLYNPTYAPGGVTLAAMQAGAASVPGALDTPVDILMNNSYYPATITFPSVNITTTPEPISMIFFGTGLVAVGGYMARRKMARKA